MLTFVRFSPLKPVFVLRIQSQATAGIDIHMSSSLLSFDFVFRHWPARVNTPWFVTKLPRRWALSAALMAAKRRFVWHYIIFFYFQSNSCPFLDSMI
jgi:hypothetical protein